MSGDRVFINEVVARDGLQIEPVFVPTPDKIALIDALSKTGVAKIEATSFVSPKAVPALADAAEVMRGVTRAPGVVYVALAPNARGAEAAISAGADEINLVISASESHNQANVRRSCDQSFDGLASIVRLREGTKVTLNGTIATAFGCPFEGRVEPARVLAFARRYRDMGVDGMTLADTTGMANPAQVERLVSDVLAACPDLPLTLHFHNTRGMGLANIVAAHRAGARSFDAALGGLGGCPFAPGATGNVCTEDVVHMFEEMGVSTGVDLQALIAQSLRLPSLVGHDTPGQVAKAGPSFAPRAVCAPA
ncbi:MAG TPA: hydroxymethylglutaryl-CoA lyase [Beijerinckiaceae bacterium]